MSQTSIIIVKGMSAMCSSCGHGISYFSRWSHSSCSIAHDGCMVKETADGQYSDNLFYPICGCDKAIPEPGTENYHHCRRTDLINAGFKNVEEITSITQETLDEWKELERKRMSEFKHRTHCNECGNKYFLEDAEWCIHYYTLGKGSKMCTQCHDCICHGETLDTISDRFTTNIEKGKFIPCDPNQMGWAYMCRTVQKVKVENGQQ